MRAKHITGHFFEGSFEGAKTFLTPKKIEIFKIPLHGLKKRKLFQGEFAFEKFGIL
jgi:hypothetical protein